MRQLLLIRGQDHETTVLAQSVFMKTSSSQLCWYESGNSLLQLTQSV